MAFDLLQPRLLQGVQTAQGTESTTIPRISQHRGEWFMKLTVLPSLLSSRFRVLIGPGGGAASLGSWNSDGSRPGDGVAPSGCGVGRDDGVYRGRATRSSWYSTAVRPPRRPQLSVV
eukprot:5744624-Pyramimonas_sp.AAC.1